MEEEGGKTLSLLVAGLEDEEGGGVRDGLDLVHGALGGHAPVAVLVVLLGLELALVVVWKQEKR